VIGLAPLTNWLTMETLRLCSLHFYRSV